MIAMANYLREQLTGWGRGWDQFWFTPTRPETLCMLRIATGWMLLYTHLVWATGLSDFLGKNAWVPSPLIQQIHASDGAWSYLWYLESPTALGLHQLLMLSVASALMVGAATRITAPLAWFLQLMYVHRLTGALFGLDQILTMMLMYLMLSPCGARWSVDAFLREKWLTKGNSKAAKRWNWLLPEATATPATRVATRLIQVHMCIIYLFGGISKMRGETWWDGTALWFAVANYEYQSLDLTWLAKYPLVFSTLSNLTIFWETFYPALVWPRLTRPWTIALAFLVHGGIGIGLGMITFGTMMIIANCAFISPEWITSLQSKRPKDES
jgi:hypothetical protein